MPRTLKDIFNDYPNLEVIEVLGYDDGWPFGLSSDGRKLKIHDLNFASQLAELPDSGTEIGHVTDEGYCIRGGYIFGKDAPKVYVYRLPPEKRTIR
jgi:hypothetical protein